MKFYPQYRAIIIFSFLLITLNTEGQQNHPLNISNVKENITIHTDRDLYLAGEDIYFTSDYFINNEKIFTQLSTVLYVELINCNDNSTINQEKIRIVNYNANGFVKIPNDIVTGNYMLRAYTQYQRNFSSLNYAYHFIKILNPENNPSSKINSSELDLISIVPEGNILMENKKNKVVIRIPKTLVNEKSKYFITDDSFNVLKEIKSLHAGIVEVTLTFENSEQYKLLLIKSNGDSIITDFPKIQKAGIQTNTVLTENQIIYKIQSRGLFKNKEILNYRIKVISNDYSIKYDKNVSLFDSIVSINLPTNLLENGINYIVLTDYLGNIQKINSLFFTKNKSLDLSVQTDKDKYLTRDSIHIKFVVNNVDSDKLSFVSTSVTLHGTKNEDNDFIPSYYFKHPLLLQEFLFSTAMQKDILPNQIMILYDRTLDKQVFEDKINTKIPLLKYIPEIRDLTISGLLRNKTTKEPIANQDVYVSVLSNNAQLHINKTNENGEFITSLNNVHGINDVILCSPDIKKNDYEILVKTSFANDTTLGSIPVRIDISEKELIERVYYNAQLNNEFEKKLNYPTNYTFQDSSFNIDGYKKSFVLNDYIKFESMHDLLHEIIPNIRLRKKKEQYSFKVMNEIGEILNGNPLILLDKVPISDANIIMGLDISKVKKIDVLYKPYILGSNLINGIVMFSTKTNNFARTILPESYKYLKYQALEEPINYSVVNSISINFSIQTPDFRTTLYWNPQIKILNNLQLISFKASDCKGIYDIEIKGYTSSGHLYLGKKQITIY